MRFRSFPVVGVTALVLMKTLACSSETATPEAPSPVTPSGDAAAPPGLRIAPGPSRGAALATSPDDKTVVSVNRDSGSVSVFRADFAADGTSVGLSKVAELPVGGEPWQVVVAPDGESAFVVLRKDQKVVKIDALGSAPTVAGEVLVGSEPTGIALTPGGTRAWVANWVDGTLTGIDTAAMKVTSTIDLNAALVATGLLGDIAARPALAHPRSIAITNDGDADENDESLLVTEYFAQRVAPEAENGANADVAKAGLVYRVALADKSVSAIRLPALADMGFKDSNGGAAGCFPNQLQAIAVNDGRAYVTSICASPRGPVGVVAGATPNVANVKTTTHGAMSVIDLATGTATTTSLHAAFDADFERRRLGDDGSRRYPAVPSDVAFVRGLDVAYVAANAADAVFRVRFASGAVSELGTPSQPFIDTNAAADKSGQNPIGIATPNLDEHKRFAFLASEITRNVSVIDFNTQSVVAVAASAPLPAPGSAADRVRRGKRFFDTATGRWSLKGQGWNGCQSCHIDGLTDNVTWFFARGPRQSTSLDGSFSKKDPTDQRIFNWTGIFDEVADFEGNTRGISGGVGAIVHTKSAPPAVSDRVDTAAVTGLSGAVEDVVDLGNPLGLTQPNVLPDWIEIKEYVQTIRPPRRPSNLDGAKVAAGRQTFLADGSCQGCHGGDKWTISKRFYDASASVSTALAAKAWTAPAGFPAALLPAADQRFMRFSNGDAAAFDQIQCLLRPVGTFGVADALMGRVTERRQNMVAVAQGDETNGKGYNPPSLFGASVGAPYFHAGNAATLEALLAPTFKAHYQALAPNLLVETDPAARAAKVSELVQFLLSIDTDTPAAAAPLPGALGGDFCAAP